MGKYIKANIRRHTFNLVIFLKNEKLLIRQKLKFCFLATFNIIKLHSPENFIEIHVSEDMNFYYSILTIFVNFFDFFFLN